MNKEWLTIKTFGQPLQLLNLFTGLASYNAGCFIQSLRKTRRGYSMVISLKPEFDCPAESHEEALSELKAAVRLHRVYA